MTRTDQVASAPRRIAVRTVRGPRAALARTKVAIPGQGSERFGAGRPARRSSRGPSRAVEDLARETAARSNASADQRPPALVPVPDPNARFLRAWTAQKPFERPGPYRSGQRAPSSPRATPCTRPTCPRSIRCPPRAMCCSPDDRRDRIPRPTPQDRRSVRPHRLCPAAAHARPRDADRAHGRRRVIKS
jgi:hypothetical protein